MAEGLASSDSSLGVSFKKSSQQAQPRGRQLLILKTLKVNLACLVLLENLIKGLAGEGRFTKDEKMKDNT